MQRIIDYYKPERAPSVDQFRALVRERLNIQAPSETETGNTLSLDDAQLFVARAEGFESWNDLVNYTKG